MAGSKILKHYALERNPFTDRTAEKSNLSPEAYYLLSDMEGFKPNETTYLFFGKRGSGKTTIRTQVRATSFVGLFIGSVSRVNRHGEPVKLEQSVGVSTCTVVTLFSNDLKLFVIVS